MMLPIPRAGTLVEVRGRDDALARRRASSGLEITIPLGRTVTPLPDGDRYLGFLFARGDDARPPSKPRCGQRRRRIDMVIT